MTDFHTSKNMSTLARNTQFFDPGQPFHTHASLASYNFCRDSHGDLSPHTSRSLYPHDVTFYCPLITAYHQECDKFMKTHTFERIGQSDVAELFSKAFSKMTIVEKASNGFRTTGIYLVNRHVFAKEFFVASEEERMSCD